MIINESAEGFIQNSKFPLFSQPILHLGKGQKPNCSACITIDHNPYIIFKHTHDELKGMKQLTGPVDAAAYMCPNFAELLPIHTYIYDNQLTIHIRRIFGRK